MKKKSHYTGELFDCQAVGELVVGRFIEDIDKIGSIYIPEDAKEHSLPNVVEIISVGPMVPKDIGFKPGDQVFLKGINGISITGTDNLYWIPYEHIVGVKYPLGTIEKKPL